MELESQVVGLVKFDTSNDGHEHLLTGLLFLSALGCVVSLLATLVAGDFRLVEVLSLEAAPFFAVSC